MGLLKSAFLIVCYGRLRLLFVCMLRQVFDKDFELYADVGDEYTLGDKDKIQVKEGAQYR